MEIEKPQIPILPADFIWMVPYDELKEQKVMMGIMMSSSEADVSVDKVIDQSPADLAGIRPGDLLLSLDDLAVEDVRDVRLVVRSTRLGDSMTVGLRRGGEEITLQVLFEELAVHG